MTTMEVTKGSHRILKQAKLMEGVEFICYGKVIRGLVIGYEEDSVKVAYFNKERNSWWEEDFYNDEPYTPCDVSIKFFGSNREEEEA